MIYSNTKGYQINVPLVVLSPPFIRNMQEIQLGLHTIRTPPFALKYAGKSVSVPLRFTFDEERVDSYIGLRAPGRF